MRWLLMACWWRAMPVFLAMSRLQRRRRTSGYASRLSSTVGFPFHCILSFGGCFILIGSSCMTLIPMKFCTLRVSSLFVRLSWGFIPIGDFGDVFLMLKGRTVSTPWVEWVSPLGINIHTLTWRRLIPLVAGGKSGFILRVASLLVSNLVLLLSIRAHGWPDNLRGLIL